MAELTKQRILDLLRADSAEDLEDLIRSLAPTSLTEAAIGLLGSGHPGMTLVALSGLVTQLAHGKDPRTGATLAAALHERATELYATVKGHGLIPTTLSGLALNHVKALSLLGRYDEILEHLNSYVPRYEQLEESENLPGLYTIQIEALVAQERYDDAAEAIAQHPSILHDRVWGVEAHRLKSRIEAARSHAGRLRGSPSDRTPDSYSTNSIKDLLQGFAPGLVAALEESRSLSPADPEDFSKLDELLEQGEEFLSKGGIDRTEITMRRLVRRASSIFVHETPKSARILDSLRDLESGLEWARAQGVHELENDALWGKYLCQSRLGKPSEAADTLLDLRRSLERRRAGIGDSLERAGVFGDYPHLFNALCEKLHVAGRHRDLFEAIESSKGRAIADKLTERDGRAVEDSAIYECVGRLPQLARSEGFHYLTYFVDDSVVYAALLDSAGRLHVPDQIGVTRDQLREAALTADPSEWGMIRGGRPGNYFPDVNSALEPMVAWLSDCVAAGIVARGDHLVYSPDEDFHNIPLHYLRFRDGLILDWFSVSRVHTSFEIVRILEQPPSRPDRFYGVVVPSQEDLDRSDGGKKVADLHRPLEWLGSHMDGAVVSHEAATIARIMPELEKRSLVHFSTHGAFPERGNPYEESFLLLADESGLPSTATEVGASGRLTPARILELKELSESHVSMMACVSGRAAEGLGGDALGLDWALLQKGVSSIVSTHWDVSAAAAARFFVTFYRKWINEGQSRSSALRHTVLELMDGDRDKESIRSWLAFSLTGDFR